MKRKPNTVRTAVQASLPTLEAQLRARLRASVVEMYDRATEYLESKRAAEAEVPYGHKKAAGE